MKKIVTFVFIMSMIVGLLSAQVMVNSEITVPRLSPAANNDNTSTIQNTRNVPPVDLDYTIDGDNVVLSWGAPEYNFVPGKFQWHVAGNGDLDNVTSAGAIGGNNAIQHGIRFTGDQLLALQKAGGRLTSIKVAVFSDPTIAAWTMRIYRGGSTDGTTYNMGTLVHTQDIPNTFGSPGYWDVETFTLTGAGVEIPMDEELWITLGHTVPSRGGTCILHSSTSNDYSGQTGFSDLTYWSGRWQTLMSASGGSMPYDILMEAFATTPSGRLVNMRDTRTFTYKIYRNDALQGSTQELTYTNTNVPDGYYTYKVTADEGSGESIPATIDVLKGTAEFNPPRNVIVTSGDKQATISWTAPVAQIPTVSGYKVYRNGELVSGSAVITGTTYVDKDFALVNGVTYEYNVEAVYIRPVGVSAFSVTVTGGPVGPSVATFPPRFANATQFDGDVTLTWKEPKFEVSPPQGTSFNHMQTPNSMYVITSNQAGTNSVYHRFSAAQLAEKGVAGQELLGVSFMIEDNTATARVKVWVGGTSVTNPGTLVVDEEYPYPLNPDDGWNYFTLPDPIVIPTDTELRIGYQYTFTAEGQGKPVTDAGVTSGTSPLVGWGDVVQQGSGTWTTLASWVSGAANHMWMIDGIASSREGRSISLRGNDFIVEEPVILAPNYSSTDVLTLKSETQNTRNFTGYNVYQVIDGADVLLEEGLTEMSYFMENVEGGFQTYKITAIYQLASPESAPAIATITVAPRVFLHFTSEVTSHVETFTENGIPTGWNEVDLDGDNQKWGRGTTTAQQLIIGDDSQGPYGQSMSRVNNTLYTPDNWLMSPRYVKPAGALTEAKLQFWAGSFHATYFQEPFSVWVSTTDKQLSSFTCIYQHVLSHPTNEWEYINLDILPYMTGDHVIFAIQHNSQFAEGAGAMGLKVDNITVALDGDFVSDFDKDIIPVKSALAGNYPNPFNPSTTIRFANATAGHVSIDIYNAKGQKVKTLVNEDMNAGNFERTWNGTDDAGRNVGSGIYFYRMNSKDFSETKKMLLMK